MIGTFSPTDVPVSTSGSTSVYVGIKSGELATLITRVFRKDFEKAKQYAPGDKAVGAEKGISTSIGTLPYSEAESGQPEQPEGSDKEEHTTDIPAQSKEQGNSGM